MAKINKYKSVKSTGKGFDFAFAGLMIVVLLITYVRIRLLNFPLERDEGEYAYMGQLILKGLNMNPVGWSSNGMNNTV